ncbi:MAG: hypothetical protein V3S09_00705 [Candidatus Bathyarchaeia archaeon]
MTTKRFLVSHYQIKLGHGMNATWNGKKIDARGVVACHGEGNRFIAYFLTDQSPVPDPVYNPSNNVGAIFLPFKECAPFIDLLRNEKPVYAYLNSAKPQWNSISTSMEPIGEEET